MMSVHMINLEEKTSYNDPLIDSAKLLFRHYNNKQSRGVSDYFSSYYSRIACLAIYSLMLARLLDANLDLFSFPAALSGCGYRFYRALFLALRSSVSKVAG